MVDKTSQQGEGVKIIRPIRASVVIQPSVSRYREPFMEALLNDPRVDVELLGKFARGSSAKRIDSHESANDELLLQVKELRLFRLGFFHWERGIVTHAIQSKSEIFVLEGRVYNVSTWIAAIILKARRRRLIFWGHGWKREENGVKLWIRRRFYGLADGHLFYGQFARQKAISSGIMDANIHIVYNSIYRKSELITSERPISCSSTEVPFTILFVGRLTARHDLALAIDAVKLATSRGASLKLVVVGTGSEIGDLSARAAGDSAIVFLGAVHELAELRLLYERADVAISPGASGLNVIQGMGFGKLVIARSDHPESGPEVEALTDDTALLFAGRCTEALSCAITEAVELTQAERASRGEAGRQIVLRRYTSEVHARVFVDAIVQTYEQGG